jgi:four helix bundle protein
MRAARRSHVADIARFARGRAECPANSSGTSGAPPRSMSGAKRYEDLIVWQLADQMRVLVFTLTSRERYVRDLKLHSQTEDAVNSVCRNIAEGSSCKHKEFARFLEISRRSVDELQDAFRSAQLKGYVTAREYEPIWSLMHRMDPAYAKLIHYLRTTPNPQPPRSRTNQAQATRTDPAQPAPTNPAQPTRTDPAQPTRTDPAQPARTDPRPI